MFITDAENDCVDAAKKQLISSDKSKGVTNKAINACKDKEFEVQTNFHCDGPCTKQTSTQQACGLSSGPKIEGAHECGNVGGQIKCCATLEATAVGSTLDKCIALPPKKDKPLENGRYSNNQISP